MNFLLAESLYEAQQYPQAIDEYEKTAYVYPRHQDSAEAGYASLVAFDALFEKTNAEQIPILRRKRIESAIRFTTSFPGDTRIATVELQTARQFLAWKDYSEASVSAQRLIENDRVGKDDKQAAWSILADAQFSSNDYAAAEASYSNLLTYLPQQGKETEAVHEQIASSIYKQGEIARNNDDHAGAAKHFTRLGKVVPGSPKRIIADYDAATAYVELKDWPSVISQLESFRNRYPKHKKFNSGVTEKLALAYSETGNQSYAAREMIALSTLGGISGERKKDLMWRSAELYEEAGESNKAIAIYKDYVRAYPYPLARSIELRHNIAESYRVSKDSKKRRYWLNEIVKADARGKGERSARSKYLAATASLELIQPQHQAYQQIKLTVPLKTSLRKKKKLMQQSLDGYGKAMKYQVEEVTTEATYQIAEIYHEFAKSLLNSQRPGGLNEEQLEEYDLLLEEQAFPFEEKAIDIHLANFKRIPAGTYDEPTRKSLKVLGELMPFRFAKVEIADAYVEF
jgi:outer membrane protein assembly factor BamD (BamD/ComL family)